MGKILLIYAINIFIIFINVSNIEALRLCGNFDVGIVQKLCSSNIKERGVKHGIKLDEFDFRNRIIGYFE